MKSLRTPLLWMCFVLFLGYPATAWAYLDPGTGSIILQGLLAAIAGALLFLKMYWYKFKSLLGLSTSGEENVSSEDGSSVETDP